VVLAVPVEREALLVTAVTAGREPLLVTAEPVEMVAPEATTPSRT
jgi:hypothetical protein